MLASKLAFRPFQCRKKLHECLQFFLSHAFNPLNADLNPICHLLALLGAHHILHISRIMVKAIPSLAVNTEDFKIDVKRKVNLSHHTLLSLKNL
jgi:hypothetical protein